jgi:hypothetical protein
LSNIVNLGGEKIAAPEQTYDYNFTLKDGTEIVEHGLLSFNPVFAGTVTEDGKLLFATPMDNVRSIKRLEPKAKLHS